MLFRTAAGVVTKEDTKIKGKELKKLRADYAMAFAVGDDAVDKLLPPKVSKGRAAPSCGPCSGSRPRV